MSGKPELTTDAVVDWLQDHFADAISNVEPLSGGYWSKAFAFTHQSTEKVIRFNHSVEGFEIDRSAHGFSSPDLKVPEVFETGEALGVFYAISNRLYGQFLEDVAVELAPQLTTSLARMFKGLRQVPGNQQAVWYDKTSTASWHDYLQNGISETIESDNDMLPVTDEVDALYRQAYGRIIELLPYCPERRDLVHGDLLHQNVLVSESADEVTAVFSWKCSAFGDFLYDVAWCTHWAPWHPGIAAIDVYAMTLAADDLDKSMKTDMALRHHCYELHVAATHVGWYLWTNDEENLAKLCTCLQGILDRGPLKTP